MRKRQPQPQPQPEVIELSSDSDVEVIEYSSRVAPVASSSSRSRQETELIELSSDSGSDVQSQKAGSIVPQAALSSVLPWPLPGSNRARTAALAATPLSSSTTSAAIPQVSPDYHRRSNARGKSPKTPLVLIDSEEDSSDDERIFAAANYRRRLKAPGSSPKTPLLLIDSEEDSSDDERIFAAAEGRLVWPPVASDDEQGQFLSSTDVLVFEIESEGDNSDSDGKEEDQRLCSDHSSSIRLDRKLSEDPLPGAMDVSTPLLLRERSLTPRDSTRPNVFTTLPQSVTDIAEYQGFCGGVDPPVDRRSGSRNLCALTFVPSLSREYLNPDNGLPVREFTVFGFPDDLIYSFRLEAATSLIPNAGNGVFLTFLGAKELKPSRKRLGKKVDQERPLLKDRSLFQPLQASHPHGFGIAVSLQGKHLKSRYNSLYALPQLKASIQEENRSCFSHTSKSQRKRKTISVHLQDPDLPYSELELQGLQNQKERIGHRRLYTIDDYVDAPRRTFSSLHRNCGFVDIGRYGPLRENDRKIDLHSQVKSFCFGFEPNNWCFNINGEQILGQDQVIDITDDLTGEPHELARRHINTYVNEVGHDPSKAQTVHAFEESNRNIKYYIKIDDPMKRGDRIEVLVDYMKGYEAVRERKGYGWKNLKGFVQGDGHYPTKLQRNLMEREDITKDIDETGLMDFYLLVDFCHDLGESLQTVANEFIAKQCVDSGKFSARQMVALRRIDWMSRLFIKRLQELKNNPGQIVVVGGAEKFLLNHCNEAIPKMRWAGWLDWFYLLESRHPQLLDTSGIAFLEELHLEAVEEMCFEVRDRIIAPFHEDRWCPLAADLTRQLCIAAAKNRWSGLDLQDLANRFHEEETKAINEVTELRNLGRFAFGKNFEESFVDDSCKRNIDKPGSPSSSKYLVVPMMEVRTPGERNHTAGLKATLKSLLRTDPQSIVLNKQWYIWRQVLVLVYSFAEALFFNKSIYSKQELCECWEVSLQYVDEALGTEVIPLKTIPDSIDCHRTNKTKRRKGGSKKDNIQNYKEVSKKRKSNSKSRMSRGLFWHIIWPILAGKLQWTLDYGNRDNDKYFLPPGIRRGAGFRTRVDYFDSIQQVLRFLQENKRYRSDATVKHALEEFRLCKDFYGRNSKNLPKFKNVKELVEWLKLEVRK